MPLVYSSESFHQVNFIVWEIRESLDFFKNKLALSEIEKKQFENLKLEQRKIEFILCRYVWQQIFHFEEPILYMSSGKPYSENFQLSISHSGRYLAISYDKTKNVGIDIQLPSEKIKRIAKKFLSSLEIEKYGDSEENLLKLWTIKEAIYKCFGRMSVQWNEDILIEKLEENAAKALFKSKDFEAIVEIELKNLFGLQLALATY